MQFKPFILLLLSVYLLCANFNGLFGQSKTSCIDLKAEEFYVKMNEAGNSVIIDVRLAPDYRDSRIPGAVLAEKSDVLKQVVDSLGRDTPLFVYCYDGDRSKTACNILTDRLQFSFVYNLKKGFEMWQRMDFPVDTARYRE